MNKAMKLATLECYEEGREFVVLDTLDAVCMRFGYYLTELRGLLIKEIDEVINA